MSLPIISIHGLGKEYHLGAEATHNTLRDHIAHGAKSALNLFRQPTKKINRVAPEKFWALRDVSFDVQQGEVVGIIGRNGAGKSTLLKILSQITDPTEGEVRMRGRVASLLEVGTGFHPELSGRENVFLNGAILGMSRVEIKRRFDEIVAFAEVEKFLDTPVKHYSSGMYVRLAFAVAAHLEPEILIVDEVLAVGDAQFQKKCLGKMQDVAQADGRTVLFVSHNMAAISNLCRRVVHLDAGRKVQDTDTEYAVKEYLCSLNQLSETSLAERLDRGGNGALRFIDFQLKTKSGNLVSCAASGQNVFLALKYKSPKSEVLKNVHVALGVHGRYDENLFHLSTRNQGFDFAELPPTGTVYCSIPRLPLQPGRYSLNIFCTVNGDVADWIRNGAILDVEGMDFFGSGQLPPIEQGSFLVAHKWGDSIDNLSVMENSVR